MASPQDVSWVVVQPRSPAMKPYLVSLVLLFTAGCVAAPVIPPVAMPNGNRFTDRGSVLAAGAELPRFGARLVQGEVPAEPVVGDRFNVAVMQWFVIEGRDQLGDACDWGVHLSLGRAGGGLRCGVGDERGGLAVGTDVSWIFARGVTGRTTVGAGLDGDGWFLHAATGLGYSANYGWTVTLDDTSFTQLEDFIYRPRGPLLVITQLDLSWVGSVAVGFPLGSGTSAFLGASVDYPFLTSDAGVECVDCDGAPSVPYTGFHPGWGLGVILGLRGLGD